MRILVTGASGLIGSALCESLEQDGREAVRLGRHAPPHDASWRTWDPARGILEAESLAGCDAVVHLAGENIAAGRWTKAKKQRIRASRVEGTRLLCERMAQLDSPPRVLVSSSAVGYYGDRGSEVLYESSAAGSGFLAEVCREWEDATSAVTQRGIRVVLARFGVVLTPRGGALRKMLTPFRLGLGGRIGSGEQYVSWVTLGDAVRALRFLIDEEAVSGPVNVAAPHPVTNSEFTKALGHALSRPTLLPLPAFAAQIVLGEMAEELLLASTRAEPARLAETGFTFCEPRIDSALRGML